MTDVTNRKRQPRGVPIGGEFASNEHDEAIPFVRAALNQRGRALAFNKHVPAVAVPQPVDGSYPTPWWDNHFAGGEYEGEKSEKSYPKMPDDNTPSKLSGNEIAGGSIDGSLRTYRRTYRGENGVAIQMPSATGIKRYSAEIDNGTFDVPVSITTPSGVTVDGWVRVTQNGKNSWSTQPLGFPENTGIGVAEGVSAVLEARNPSMGLRGIQSFAERRRQRAASAGVPFEAIERSSFITGLSYETGTNTAIVRIGDRVYGYADVKPETYLELRTSPNLGAAYNKLLKHNPEVSASFPVPFCDKCGNAYPPKAQHRCADRHTTKTVGVDADFNQAARQRATRVRGQK